MVQGQNERQLADTAAALNGQAPTRGTVKLGAPLITQANAKDDFFPNSPF
jgi:ribose transport system substrate-binding protein